MSILQSEPGRDPVTISSVFKVSPQRLFKAWTEPDELKKWFGPEGMECTIAEMDLRTGGSYRFSIRNNEGGTHVVGGVYQEIRPPEKLVYTWQWENLPDFEGVEMLVTLDFGENGNETELTLTQEKLPDEKARDAHNQGWNGCLDCLEKFLA